MKVFNLRSFLIGKLRRLSYMSPVRKEVKARARMDRGIYQCELCKKRLHNGEYALDHIEPVVSVTRGFVDWNEFISKLFVDASGLQLLCKDCHSRKTKQENITRRKNYDRKKTRRR